MSFWGKFSLCAATATVLLAMCGCEPPDSRQQDEEKEQHYVLARGRVNAMDYEGAVEGFKESLEVNPRSAAAHYQLAWLYDTKISDPAAAIYHYQEYLRLTPKADNAEVVRQRVTGCKQQLAADVLPLPSTPAAQRQIENLAETNRLLQAQIAQLNDSLKKWSDYAAGLQAGRPGTSPQDRPDALPSGASIAADYGVASSARDTGAGATRQQGAAAQTTARTRTHVVVAGETMAAIARKHGVSLPALQAANPGVVPTKLKVGQTLSLP
jgi:tetratricopeptide (TPR) repeat protein